MPEAARLADEQTGWVGRHLGDDVEGVHGETAQQDARCEFGETHLGDSGCIDHNGVVVCLVGARNGLERERQKS